MVFWGEKRGGLEGEQGEVWDEKRRGDTTLRKAEEFPGTIGK